MNRIDELIECLCPDGVEYKALGEVGKFIRGSSIQKKDFVDEGVGCIHYGQLYTHYGLSATQTKSFITESFAKGKRMAFKGDLVIATTSENEEDVCKAMAWLGDGKVAVSNDAYIYRHSLNPKYIAYFFNSSSFEAQKKPYITGTKVLRVSGENMAKIRIPVPPMEIQAEIVKVLDSFAELEAELEARKAQFSYYREKLLAESAASAEQIAIGKMKTFTGSTPKKSESRYYGSEYPFYKPGDFASGEATSSSEDGLTEEGYEASRQVAVGSTMMVCIGATIGKVGYALADGACNQQINVILPDTRFNPRYVFHLMNSSLVQNQVLRLGSFSSMPILSLKKFNQIPLPMPPMDVQDEVVAMLDKFDSLVHDISDGLLAEINARRQQYVYYRDKLFLFKERRA